MNLDPDKVVRAVVSANGYIPLAIERLKKDYPNQSINEYEVLEIITADDATNKSLVQQIRAQFVVKMIDNINSVQQELMNNLGELKPKELASLLSSMMSSFATMTAPAAKDTFDFEAEVAKTAAMLNIPEDEVRDDLKAIRASKSNPARKLS